MLFAQKANHNKGYNSSAFKTVVMEINIFQLWESLLMSLNISVGVSCIRERSFLVLWWNVGKWNGDVLGTRCHPAPCREVTAQLSSRLPVLLPAALLLLWSREGIGEHNKKKAAPKQTPNRSVFLKEMDGISWKRWNKSQWISWLGLLCQWSQQASGYINNNTKRMK